MRKGKGEGGAEDRERGGKGEEEDDLMIKKKRKGSCTISAGVADQATGWKPGFGAPESEIRDWKKSSND